MSDSQNLSATALQPASVSKDVAVTDGISAHAKMPVSIELNKAAQDLIQQSRESLVITTTANPLLHLNYSPNTCIQITDEKPDQICTLLLKDGQELTFAHSLSATDEFNPNPIPLPLALIDASIKKRHRDQILQTTHAPQKLQENLRSIERTSKNSIEVKGAHSLYLALGSVHWQSEDGQGHRAPLVLVPVDLKRESVDSPFKLKYNGQDVTTNLALQKRLKEEFGVVLPNVPELQDFSVLDYCNKVQKAIDQVKGGKVKCSVHPEEISLHNFSFGNFVLYNDLDPANWTGNDPAKHPLIRAIVSGGFEQNSPSFEPRLIDRQFNPVDRFYVLNHDSSQLCRLEELPPGTSGIIQGAAGTGKTTVAVNVAANTVANGGKVLFVASKNICARSFLSWLQAAGLRSLAVDMHSESTRASIVADQAAALAMEQPVVPDRHALCAQQKVLKERLNNHSELLSSQLFDTGFSVYQVLANAINLKKDEQNCFDLKHSEMRSWTKADYDQALNFAKELQAYYLAHGSPVNHPFWGSALVGKDAVQSSSLQQQLFEAYRFGSELQTKMSALFNTLGLDASLTLAEITGALQALSLIDELRTENGAWSQNIDFSDPLWVQQGESLLSKANKELEYAKILEKTKNTVNYSELAGADLNLLTQQISNYQNRSRFWRALFPGEYKDAVRQIKSITTLPKDLNEQVKLVKLLKDIKELQSRSHDNDSLWRKLFDRTRLSDNRYSATYWAQTVQLIEGFHVFAKAIKGHNQTERLANLMRHPKDVYQNSAGIAQALSDIKRFQAELSAVLQTAKFSQSETENNNLEEQVTRLHSWSRAVSELPTIIKYNDLLDKYSSSKGAYIAEKCLKEPNSKTKLADSFQLSWFRTLADEVVKTNFHASQFNDHEQQELIANFAEVEEKVRAANAAEILSRVYQQRPHINAGGESGVLHTELEKKSGHVSTRQLMQQAGNALLANTPIVVSSFQNAATFFDSATQFDLVIIDEGSLAPFAETIGSIARGKSVLVLGDQDQMRISGSFGKVPGVDFMQADGNSTNCRSVLDVFEAAGMPSHTLEWHYRSTRSGAIQIANQEFYDGNLKIFPNAERGPDADGLSFTLVPNSTYEVGKGTNENEARAVADAVLDNAIKHPEKSLAVIAFNEAQANLIAEEVERRRHASKALDNFLNQHTVEDFFITNLENVQSAERDVILVSVGYAKTQDDKLSMNFGPVNAEFGENRINVLMTRHKANMHIFSGLTGEEPEFENSSSKGVAVLKQLLQVARSGNKLDAAYDQHGLDPFQVLIKKELENLGYIVETNVGPFGSGVDLAVVHPKDPNHYILGIQTDGAQYQSIASAHDRDKTKPEALTKRGWNLYQAWSIDWYRYPEKKIREIDLLVKRLLRAEKNSKELPATARAEHVIEFERRKKASELATTYQKFVGRLKDLEKEPGEFPDAAYTQVVTDAISCIVNAEGPIHKQEALKRLREITGKRKGGVLDTYFELGLEKMPRDEIVRNGEFLYLKDQQVLPRSRAELGNDSRVISFIAAEEIDALLLKIIKSSFGIATSELVKTCSSAFGLKKTDSDAESVISKRIAELNSRGWIQQTGETWRVTRDYVTNLVAEDASRYSKTNYINNFIVHNFNNIIDKKG